MIRDSFNDVIIEPQRQSLIPGFKDVQRGAMSAGALGCSISGAGPAIFAWSEIQHAEAVRGAMVAAFERTVCSRTPGSPSSTTAAPAW